MPQTTHTHQIVLSRTANCIVDKPLFKKYYMHNTSHFIGLDVHDVGQREIVFQPGMVLSCEPGIYVAEEGIGVRLETDVVVGEYPIDLLADVPIEVAEIEALVSFTK